MSELYDEIKEDVTSDRHHKLWRDYGSYVIGILIAIVVVIGLKTGWDYYQNSQKEALGDALFQAHVTEQSMKFDEALSLYDSLLQRDGNTFSAKDISFLRVAGVHLKQNETNKALAAYKQATENPQLQLEMRQLAAVLYSYNVLGAEITDEAALANTATMLKTLLAEEAFWPYSVMEIRALYALKTNDTEAAKQHLSAIEEAQDAPLSMKQRAKAMIMSL